MKYNLLFIITLLCVWSLHVQGIEEAQCLEKAPACPTACNLECEKISKTPLDAKVCKIGLDMCMSVYKSRNDQISKECNGLCMTDICKLQRPPKPEEIAQCRKTNCTEEMESRCDTKCSGYRNRTTLEIDACKENVNKANDQFIQKNVSACIKSSCIDAPNLDCKRKTPYTRAPTAQENEDWDANCVATNASKYAKNMERCKSSKPTFVALTAEEKGAWFNNCVSSFDQGTCNATCRANAASIPEYQASITECSKKIPLTSEESKSCKKDCAANYDYTNCYGLCESHWIEDPAHRLECRVKCREKDIENYAHSCETFTQLALNFTGDANATSTS